VSLVLRYALPPGYEAASFRGGEQL